MYLGKTKTILKFLGFLQLEFGMNFEFQTFDNYYGFAGPVDTYSFYNQNGCFTLHNIVQRGEWGWYISDEFYCDQYRLLQTEICQSDYLKKSYLFLSSWLRDLSNILRKEASEKGRIFNINL